MANPFRTGQLATAQITSYVKLAGVACSVDQLWFEARHWGTPQQWLSQLVHMQGPAWSLCLTGPRQSLFRAEALSGLSDPGKESQGRECISH